MNLAPSIQSSKMKLNALNWENSEKADPHFYIFIFLIIRVFVTFRNHFYQHNVNWFISCNFRFINFFRFLLLGQLESSNLTELY